MSERYLLCCKL